MGMQITLTVNGESVTREAEPNTLLVHFIRDTLRLTGTQKDSLLAFFNTIVNGMASVFTYTDTGGTAYSVRFATPVIDGLIEKAGDAWETTVELRITA